MITVSTTTAQTVQPGQAITFNELLWKSGCAEFWREGSSNIQTAKGVFELDFHANIGGETAATAVQLALAADSAALADTTMISVPAATTDLNNVSAHKVIGSGCCINSGSSVSVINNGTEPVVVGVGASLSVRRVAGSNC